MKKFRSHVGLIAIAASLSLLGACSDNDNDEVVDSGAVTETPDTTPPASTEAPAPATSGDMGTTAPATTPSTADGTAGTTGSSATSSTPDTGSGASDTSDDPAPATGTQ